MLMCPQCHWLIPSHPKFEAYFMARDFQEWKRAAVTCRCPGIDKARQREMQLLIEAAKAALDFMVEWDVQQHVISGLSLQLRAAIAQAEGKK